MSTPYVEYEYADGSANTLRLTRVSYPNGRTLDYSYGASGSDDDWLSRVYQLKDGATVLAQYNYLGSATFARCELPQPQLRWNLSPSGNSFSGLDALDRTVDCLWQKYAPSASTPVQVGYTYDRASNRTSRDVAGATGNDERYRYDGLNRLTDLDRGDLAAHKITSPQAAEQWRLDATGNWSRYENLDFVTPGNSLDQDRSANRANEITGFTSTVGASWSQPAYDRAGNMTTFPQPAAPASSFTATYDPWNRLVGLSDGSTYVYDALNRRTVQVAAGVTRHYYYSNAWQVQEERLGTTPDSASAERQFVWGLRYIDDLVLRDRSPTNNGTLSERLYALQDANWNVVAVADTSGAVQERYRYSAYGTPIFLQADFTPRSPNQSGCDWETLYAGYRFDKASGLYQVRFRYLNSTMGAWLSRDPLGFLDGLNLSRYAVSNPLALTDPFGLVGQDLKEFAWAVKSQGLSPEGARALHDRIQDLKEAGGKVSKQVLLEEAKAIKDLGGKFVKIGGVALLLAFTSLENSADAAEVKTGWRRVPSENECECECAEFRQSVIVPSWWVTGENEWGPRIIIGSWESFGKLTAEECGSIEDGPNIVEETGVLGYKIYNTSSVMCRFNGVE